MAWFSRGKQVEKKQLTIVTLIKNHVHTQAGHTYIYTYTHATTLGSVQP